MSVVLAVVKNVLEHLKIDVELTNRTKPLNVLVKAAGYSFPKLSAALKNLPEPITIRPESLKTICDDDFIKIGLRGGILNQDGSRKLIPALIDLLLPQNLPDRETNYNTLVAHYSEKLEEHIANGFNNKLHARKLHKVSSGKDDRKHPAYPLASAKAPPPEAVEEEQASEAEWQEFLNRKKSTEKSR